MAKNRTHLDCQSLLCTLQHSATSIPWALSPIHEYGLFKTNVFFYTTAWFLIPSSLFSSVSPPSFLPFFFFLVSFCPPVYPSICPSVKDKAVFDFTVFQKTWSPGIPHVVLRKTQWQMNFVHLLPYKRYLLIEGLWVEEGGYKAL